MRVTLFSVTMALLLSTAACLLIRLFRRQAWFVRSFGPKSILLLYGLCAVRLVFVLEAPAAKPVDVPPIYNPVYATVRQVRLAPASEESQGPGLAGAALGLWLLGSGIMTARFIRDGLRVAKKLRDCPSGGNWRQLVAERALEQVKGTHGLKIEALVCPGLEAPAGIGLIKRRILLPDRDYTRTELYYILKHEYLHFVHGDLWIKALMRLICCAFWWDPAVYLLRADVGQLLEIRCDMAASGGLEPREKLAYLTVILDSLRYSAAPRGSYGDYGARLTGRPGRALRREMTERFRLISSPPKTRYGWKRAAVAVAALAVFCASYGFVFVPYYEAGTDDWEVPQNDFYYIENVDTEGAYIQEFRGMYFLVVDDSASSPRYMLSGQDLRSHEIAGVPVSSGGNVSVPISYPSQQLELKLRVFDSFGDQRLQYRVWDATNGRWLEPFWQYYTRTTGAITYRTPDGYIRQTSLATEPVMGSEIMLTGYDGKWKSVGEGFFIKNDGIIYSYPTLGD